MISLIVATVGRADDLKRLFASLAAQTNHDLELLVVDQNRDERVRPIVELAERAGLSVQHLRQSTPNLSKARNLGFRHARGEIVAFPDDDCWYEPDTVAAALASFNLHPTTAALVADWVEQSAGLGNEPDGQLLDLHAWRAFRGGHASSITLFFRRDVLHSLEGFDECLGVGQWYGAAEETDLVLRALAKGFEMRRCHAVRVHHRFAQVQEQAGGEIADWSRARRRARGAGALYAKHCLAGFVITRGLVAPAWRAIAPPWRKQAFVSQMAMMLGRLEGYIGWKMGRRT